ncbi:hypothetical protein BDZ91DRAFT_794790 [Kalaharituber pfeilii]|nr:hypothetical protein BDZ91DRAFT_794790 [Kalaharituber pfeilii]
MPVKLTDSNFGPVTTEAIIESVRIPSSPTATLAYDLGDYLDGYDLVIKKYNGFCIPADMLQRQKKKISDLIAQFVRLLRGCGVTTLYTNQVSVESLMDFRDHVKNALQDMVNEHYNRYPGGQELKMVEARGIAPRGEDDLLRPGKGDEKDEDTLKDLLDWAGRWNAVPFPPVIAMSGGGIKTAATVRKTASNAIGTSSISRFDASSYRTMKQKSKS